MSDQQRGWRERRERAEGQEGQGRRSRSGPRGRGPAAIPGPSAPTSAPTSAPASAPTATPSPRRSRREPAVYALTVGLPVAALLAGLAWLDGSGRLAGAGKVTRALAPASVVDKLLIATVVIVAMSALAGVLARRLGQPAVVGELVAGLVLGPSVLGEVAPSAQHWLFPAVVLPYLNAFAQFGVIFFMFLIGAELAPKTLLRGGPRALVLGHASVALPFLVGVGVAWGIRHRYPPTGTGTLPFLLFVGLSFAITAFPVLARILVERNLLKTRIGAAGISVAGVGDVTAWALLAVLVAFVRHASLARAGYSLLGVLEFAVIMLTVVRRIVTRLVERVDRGEGGAAALSGGLVCLVLASALATDWMGVHAIFGAFLAGVIVPGDALFVRDLTDRIEGVTMWVMLPLFFVTVGLQTRLAGLDGASWLILALVVGVAVATKVTGVTGAALLLGEDRRSALALGVMMNCRGLTELIVLQVGLQLGVLDQRLFAVFVMMALVTTAMTGPLLSRLRVGAMAVPGGFRRRTAVDADSPATVSG